MYIPVIPNMRAIKNLAAFLAKPFLINQLFLHTKMSAAKSVVAIIRKRVLGLSEEGVQNTRFPLCRKSFRRT